MGEGYHPGYPSRVTRRVAPLLLALLLPGVAEAGSTVARLADQLASEVLRLARGRTVELAASSPAAPPAGAAEFPALLEARLQGRVPLSTDGPRLRVEWAVSEAPQRLLASARVVEEPGARLLDIVSASAAWDEGTVPLSPQRGASPRTAVDVVATSRSAPIQGVVLALAWLADDRVLVVFEDEAALYRLEASALTLESRRALPRPLSPVRSPGAVAIAEPAAAWTLTSAAAAAALVAIEGDRLALRSRAEAVPWRGSPAGLRFRSGTNLIEATAPGLGSGPFVALEPSGIAGVDADGELRVAGPAGPFLAGLRVGSALAALWDGMLAASSAIAPAAEDALFFVDVSEGGAVLAESIPVEGSIRALASRPSAEGARLIAAVEEAGGRSRLVLLDLRRRGP
jgi:hypothetical protein